MVSTVRAVEVEHGRNSVAVACYPLLQRDDNLVRGASQIPCLRPAPRIGLNWMNSNDLNATQARQIDDQIRKRLDYLSRLKTRREHEGLT